MTHTVTHTATVPNGKNDIFPNTLASKPENQITFQNFLKSFFSATSGCGVMYQILACCLRQVTGEDFCLICFVIYRAGRVGINI